MEPFVERLTGEYDGVAFPDFLPEGSLSDGKNMRKISALGGWKPRKGYSLLNTTAAAAAPLGVWSYQNKATKDYHIISQIDADLRDMTSNQEELLTEGGEVLLAEDGEALAVTVTAEPFTEATSIGTSIFSGVSGEVPGFAAIVGDEFIFADGSGAPVICGGESPLCEALLLASGTSFVDYSTEVRDSNSDTYAAIPASGTPVYYVCSKERASGILLNFGSVNTNNVSVTIAARRSGSWTNVSGQNDGTAGTYTHDTDGTIEWTASSSDESFILGNRMGYWYRVTFSGTPTAVQILKCRVVRAASRMTNKWDGTYRYPTGAMYYDASAGVYQDRLGAVTSVSEDEYMDLASGTTSDFLYIKAPEPVAIFGFAIPEGQINSANAQIDTVEYFNGAWTSIGFADTTLDGGADSSFGQTGFVKLTASHAPAELILDGSGDTVPGYWYRISWDAALSAETRIYTIVYGAQPADFSTIEGVVEFQGRAIYWGHPNYPNRLIRSPYERPDELCTLEEKLSQPCGSGTIIACVVLQDILVVLLDNGVYYTPDGYTMKVVSHKVGIVARAGFAISEFGDKQMNQEQVQSVALWPDSDGVYKFDKTGLAKISGAIDHYFNPVYDTVLTAEEMQGLQAKVNPLSNEYHLVLPSTELVYALETDEWYPPWERALPLQTINVLKDKNDRYRIVGGAQAGFLLLLDEADNDRDSSNAEVAIEHSIKTREFTSKTLVMEFLVRRIWAMMKAQTSGSVVCKIYPEHASSGTTEEVPAAITLVKSGKTYGIDNLDMSQEEITSFSIELTCNAVDTEMWVMWLAFLIEETGLQTGG
jgi:hypothetical protein